MDRVHTVKEKQFSQIVHVAVAIRAVDGGGRHTGILHRETQTGEVKLLHLAWHHRLENSVPEEGYLWVELRIHPARARQVAARCRQIVRANSRDGIPYGFSRPTDRFDEQTGRFLFGPTKLGLTCASFVLAVFDYACLALVEYGSWEGRDDDVVWQRWIVEMLRNRGADPQRVEAVQKEIGCVRYRPEEVAGAAAIYPPAVRFNGVREVAQQILSRLSAG